jgi:hypothetical protein
MTISRKWLWLLLATTLSTGCIDEFKYKYALKADAQGPGVDGGADITVADNTTDQQTPLDLEPQDICVPQCKGKACGDNGCGGVCGQCGTNEVCNKDGKCKCPSGVGCMGSCCQENQVCGADGSCCVPDCGEPFCGLDGCGTRECGTNGCGISCGKCGANELCGRRDLHQRQDLLYA